MRRLPLVTAMGLGLALLAACTDSPVVPATHDSTPSGDPSQAALLAGDEIRDIERPLLSLEGWTDSRTVIPLEILTPEAASNIGPGSAILIEIPDEGRFGCSANFVWQTRGRYFLGSAGHCFLPEDATSTHGPGADYDASGVVVQVCVEGCEGNFRTNQLVGTWVTLGEVAYARQSNEAGSGVGHDFGVVEIPRQLNELVRTSMPVFGGPNGVHELELGDVGCHYGHGLGFGEVFPTKGRVGVGGQSDANSWAGDFLAAFGDSGSGLLACSPDGLNFLGKGAVGVLTHLGVRVNPLTGEHGVVLGTTIARSIEMAWEARLKISLVME